MIAKLKLNDHCIWSGLPRLPRLGACDAGLTLLQAGAGSVGYTALLIVGVTRSSAAKAGILAGARLALPVALATVGVRTVAFSPEAVEVSPITGRFETWSGAAPRNPGRFSRA